DDDGSRDLLEISRDVQDVQPVLHDPDDESSDQRAPGAPQSSGEAGTADDRRGDRVELVSETESGLARSDPRGQDNRGNRIEQSGVGVDEEEIAIRLDSGNDGGLEIASDRVSIPAPQRMLQYDVGYEDADH